MKISIIGGGNVGSLAAMRLAQEGCGEIVLVDIVKGLACGKAFDMEDASNVLKNNYRISGSDEIEAIKDSGIVVITAGLARKPGMTREELLAKNASILKEVAQGIKRLAPAAVVVVVTNPLDIMTYYILKCTGFDARKVIGMGISLDCSRFANLISRELSVPPADIDAMVIGSHGEGMLPLARFSTIKGVTLDEFLDDSKVKELIEKTVNRGAEIVSLLGSGSAYFAPSAAVASLVKAIAKDEKRTIGVCAYLNGEYGIKDSCIGVPCRLGRNGIEQIINLELNKEELLALHAAADSIQKRAQQLIA